MATQSTILAWEIPWTKEHGRLQRCRESDTTQRPNNHNYNVEEKSFGPRVIECLALERYSQQVFQSGCYFQLTYQCVRESQQKYKILYVTEFCLKFYLFLYWPCWVFAAARTFLQLQREGPALQSWCVRFSLQRFLLLWSPVSKGARASVVVGRGLSSCSSRALEHKPNGCDAQASFLHGMWDLPGPGIKPVSASLAGRFFTTESPGKPCISFF